MSKFDKPVLNYLVKKIEEEQADLRVEAFDKKDFSSDEFNIVKYRIEGLSFVTDEIEKLLSEMDEDYEDDDDEGKDEE